MLSWTHCKAVYIIGWENKPQATCEGIFYKPFYYILSVRYMKNFAVFFKQCFPSYNYIAIYWSSVNNCVASIDDLIWTVHTYELMIHYIVKKLASNLSFFVSQKWIFNKPFRLFCNFKCWGLYHLGNNINVPTLIMKVLISCLIGRKFAITII